MTRGFKEITLEEKEGLKIICLRFNDMLDKDDYELFVPQLEGFLRHKDKVRLLIVLKDFKGFTLGALWEETKFSFNHYHDIDRIAVVGDNRIEKIITGFTKPFTKAETRFFNIKEKKDAKEWLNENV